MANKLPQTIADLEAELERIEREGNRLKIQEEFEQLLGDYKGPDAVISFQEYLEEKGGLSQQKRYPIGIEGLDKAMGGVAEGDLIVVTGMTGEGKTAFCQELTHRFIAQQIKSLWFSYEVLPEELIRKFGEKIPEGYLPRVLIEKNIIWIERKIVEGIAKFGIKVVFIDHLHYLFDMKEYRNTSLEIGQIMRELKIIAKKYGVVIFVIAHLMKIGEMKGIELSDIRDSSFVGQESDFVLAIWRGRETLGRKEKKEVRYLNEAIVKMLKNRPFGKLSSVKLYFYKNRFYEHIEEIPTDEV